MSSIPRSLVQDIIRFNALDCPNVKSTLVSENDEISGRGIWLRTAMANHSCLPNAERAFIGDMIILRARKEIKTGEEIFITYCPGLYCYKKRRDTLDLRYNFECSCALCSADQAGEYYTRVIMFPILFRANTQADSRSQSAAHSS